MRRHVVLPTTWACCMGDVQEFDVELRAHREFFLNVRLRTYRLCALGGLRRRGLADCDGVAGALSCIPRLASGLTAFHVLR